MVRNLKRVHYYVYDARIGKSIVAFNDGDSTGPGPPTFPMPVPCDQSPFELPGAPAD